MVVLIITGSFPEPTNGNHRNGQMDNKFPVRYRIEKTIILGTLPLLGPFQWPIAGVSLNIVLIRWMIVTGVEHRISDNIC